MKAAECSAAGALVACDGEEGTAREEGVVRWIEEVKKSKAHRRGKKCESNNWWR